MSMSPSLSPKSGALFPLIIACKVEAISGSFNFSKSTWVLAGLAFLPSSNELERSSSPGHGHFQCLLQDSSLSYGCSSMIGSVSSPRCNLSGRGVSHLGYAMSIVWMVCEGQGCLSVLGCKKVAHFRGLKPLLFVLKLQ